MTILEANRRALPDFERWLEKHSPGTKAPDFEAFADLARRSQEQAIDHLDPMSQAFGRMWMGASIAAVELCNMEALKHGTAPKDILALLPRVFACAAMYATASICKEDTPFRDIAKVMTEEFRAATKAAADQLVEQFDRGER